MLARRRVVNAPDSGVVVGGAEHSAHRSMSGGCRGNSRRANGSLAVASNGARADLRTARSYIVDDAEQLVGSERNPARQFAMEARRSLREGTMPLGGHRDDALLIHVRDERRGTQHDFKCSRLLLVSKMLYFEQQLLEAPMHDEVKICINCDVKIFEWLLAYIHDPKKVDSLDVSTVVSILISADFLRMPELVDACLAFLHRHVNEVVRQPFDLSCLSDNLAQRLAERFTDEALDLIQDRRDRLQGRLFAQKLASLLSDPAQALHRCSKCQRLFTAAQLDVVVCPKATVAVGFHGGASLRHTPDASWTCSQYVRECRERQGLTWQSLYWRIWGCRQLLRCTVCLLYFTGEELGHCAFHPQRPVWPSESKSSDGIYPCCQQPARVAGQDRLLSGCCARDHIVSTQDELGRAVVARIHKYRDVICRRFLSAASEKDVVGVVDGRRSDNDRQPVGGDAEDHDCTAGEDIEGGDASEEPWPWAGSFSGGRGQRMTLGTADWRYCYHPILEHMTVLEVCPGQGGGPIASGRCNLDVVARRSGSPGVTWVAAPSPSMKERRRQRSFESRQSRPLEHSPSLAIPGTTVTCPESLPRGVQTFFTTFRSRNVDLRWDALREDDRRRMNVLAEHLSFLRDAALICE